MLLLAFTTPHSHCHSFRTLTAGGRGAAAPRTAVRHEAVGEFGKEWSAQEEQQVVLKFTNRFRNNFLRKHLEDAVILHHASDGYSQPILSRGFKQQQQQWQRADGVGSPGLAFGGLSFEECTAVFFAPNARCHYPAFPAGPAVPPNLSPFASPPPASQAPHFASQAATFSAAATAASTSQLPFARDAYLVVAAASNATSLRRPMKRPRDDCAGLGGDQPLLGGRESPLMRGGVMRGGMERGGMACRGVVCSTQSRRQSVAEQFQQQGESSRAHAADEALLEALLQEGLRQQQQQGGARSRVQRVLWPHVGSESALPDDVLLGFSSEDAALTKRAALSAPPPIHPRARTCKFPYSHAQPCCSNPSPLVVLYRLSANPMLLPCPDVAFTPRVDGGAPCATDGHRLSRSAWMGVTD
ncbi:unnamed protein product [Closterium sp. NIES-64]|nr:unnamed protein product [Closterium sp. NIES-64]